MATRLRPFKNKESRSLQGFDWSGIRGLPP